MMISEDTRPKGIITFLFTDIEQSTLFWDRHKEKMRSILARHDALLRLAIKEHGGLVVKTTGDGFHAAFDSVVSALNTAVTAQYRLYDEDWLQIAPDQLRVRMGLHSGEAQWRDGDYYGTAVNRAARIMSLGHGGQILLSGTTAALLQGHLPAPISLRDLGQHPLRGLQEDAHIFQVVDPRLPGDFPPLKSSQRQLGNLPTYASSFIGRKREIAEIRSALNHARLLTLTGPGGTGKTRLSLQLAADVRAAYTHGAWLVELAPLTNPELVVKTTAAIFGLQEVTNLDIREILIDYLREKHLLLILDNCEHVVDACARLAAGLISSCPRVTILASSREELGVYGEITYQLPTLSLPSSNGQTADSVVRSEAVQLFIERAAAARPGFKLNDANAPAVIKVVRHLDGIPLAIELAAARLKVFSVEQVASRLDQRFQLLTGGSRTLMPRQQTLRALIDWSYDLLDEDEHDLFRRLSVFVGFWTFEAAENIAQPLDAYTLLPQLVSKSLVSFDQEAEPEPRYFYLETIRQYAHDRLVESGGLEDARDRHFAYYESLARSVGFGVGQARRAVEEGQLLLEADNLRAAVEWGSTRFPERTINGIWNLLPLLSVQFPGTISIEWTSKALQRLKSLPAPTAAARQNRERTRMRGMIAISMMKMFIGQLNEARRIAEEVVEQLWVEDCDPFLLAIALYIKAQTGYFLEDPTIEETLARAMNVLQDMEDGPVKAWMLAMVLLLSAETESRKGNTELVEQYLQESTAAVRHANTFFLPWVELSRLLIILQMDLSPEVTKQHFERAIDFLSASQNRRMVAMANSEWAHMMRHRGNFDEALDIYRHMLVEWRELGHRAALANILENIAFVDRVQGRPTQAVALLGAAERIREMIDQDMLRPEREEYEQEMAALRNVVAPSEWDTLWSRGRRLTIDDVIALAIATD